MSTLPIQSVNSIYALKNSVNPDMTVIYEALGYWKAFDGGGNRFNFVLSESLEENGGTIIKSNRIINGYFVAQEQTKASLTQFGATGDGVTDDTTFIQKAINTVGKPSAKKGVYRITQTITVSSNQGVIGEGWKVENNIVTNLIDGNSTTFLLGADCAGFKYDGTLETFADNIEFRNIAIYRQDKTSDTQSCALFFDAIRASCFENIYIYNTNKGLYFTGQCWQTELDRVWTNGCINGIESNASLEDSSLRNCVMRFGDVGFKHNYAGQTLAFYNCDLSRNRIGLLLNSGGTYNAHVEITACQFEMATGADAAIWIETASTIMPSMTVSGSRFLSLENTPAAPCIYIKNKAHIITTRNTVKNCYDFISVATEAKTQTEIIMIEDELTLSGGVEVRNDDGTFVTKIKSKSIKVPTGSSNGIQIGTLAKFRVTDAGGYEIVLSDATIARAADGELSLISASSKAVRMKPGGTQVAVFGATTTTLSNKLIVSGLPTSSAGLSANELWVDTTAANVVKRV